MLNNMHLFVTPFLSLSLSLVPTSVSRFPCLTKLFVRLVFHLLVCNLCFLVFIFFRFLFLFFSFKTLSFWLLLLMVYVAIAALATWMVPKCNEILETLN